MRRLLLGLAATLLLAGCGGDPQAPAGGGAIADFTRDMEAVPGFLPFYVDRKAGRLYFAVSRFDEDMIYQTGLPQGVGSNDLGFDRGELDSGPAALVRFERAGDRVLLHRRNTTFRAVTDSAEERAAVEEAFASSVLWGFPVVARHDGAFLVDATDFLLRDARGLARELAAKEQGTFKVDPERSALYFPRTKGFPRNSEFEATVTFTGDDPGEFLEAVAPDAHSFSVRMHHSFVALPEPGYEPRAYHPESGFWSFSYRDYATPIDEPVAQRFIPRHRLEKRNPRAERSAPVEPIVYYLDPGTPEPVRSALLEGASWWNQAFEAAGYEDAFRVELLPPEADPMDVRYNVIQWVHRATRGWSYGSSVLDPRTGEIIKGHVTLGSLRVRQDWLIAQGMTSPFETGEEPAPELKAMALARIRQLSAHEVGHTLGLAHNFAASGRDRASVMDYPQPLIRLDEDGEVTLTGAYDTGIGAWDKRAITYGYGHFGKGGKERAALAAFVREGREAGFEFISDPDSREARDFHPRSHLWDNGADAVAELERMLALRAVALGRLGAETLKAGTPYSALEGILVPVYFYHRYQVEAVGKWLGGVDYRYAVREPGQAYRQQAVPAAEQQRALDALLATLAPAQLALPAALRAQLPPQAYGYERTRENPGGYMGALPDPVSLAEAGAAHTLGVLLHPERLARMAWQHAVDKAQPGVEGLFRRLEAALVTPVHSGEERLLTQRAAAVLLGHWRALLTAEAVAPEVRAEAHAALERSARFFHRQLRPAPGYAAFYAYQLALIDAAEAGEGFPPPPPARELPPGSPIGG